MRKCFGVAVGIIMVFVFMGTSVAAESQLPGVMVMDIIKQMKHAFEFSHPTVCKTMITTTDNMGRTYETTAGRAWKDFPEGKRALLVVLEPKDARGIAYTIWERTKGKQESSFFVYLPYLRRVRELIGLQAYDRFLDTEFTYSDLGFIPVDERYTLLGVEEHNGVRAYKIEEKMPKERRFYSRIMMWVAVDSGLPVERDYYDTADRLWKTELFKEVTVFDGIPVPRIVEMKDVQENFKTELKIVTMKSGANIPDEMFDPEYLEKASEAPVWKLFDAEPGK